MSKYSLMMVCCITLLFCFLAGCVSISYEVSGEVIKHPGKNFEEYALTFKNTDSVTLTDIVFNVTRNYNSPINLTYHGEETKQIMFDNVPPNTTIVNSTQFTCSIYDFGVEYTYELVESSKSS